MRRTSKFCVKKINFQINKNFNKFSIAARLIIHPHPNSYCYTKSLAEQIVQKYAKNLNTIIVRPAIITATYLEPIAGYTDNVYGLNGVLVGAGVGVLRILRIDNKLKSNILPADYVVNLIMAASFYQNEIREFKEIKIYNFSASDENYVT
jgi:nucleoside-diphosphate-sugar epimerase